MTLYRVALFCALAGFLAGRPLWGASLGADTLAARVKACTACHGEQGRAGPDGYYPRLAGKPAGYLYHQLLNFRDGRRHYGLMSTLVEPLTDRYLMEIARYFADLQVPYPPPARPVVSDSVLAHGRRIAVQGEPQRGVPACTHCHGERLTGMLPATPGLLGLPQDYVQALGAPGQGEGAAIGLLLGAGAEGPGVVDQGLLRGDEHHVARPEAPGLDGGEDRGKRGVDGLDRAAIDLAQQKFGEGSQAALGVTHGGSAIAIT